MRKRSHWRSGIRACTGKSPWTSCHLTKGIKTDSRVSFHLHFIRVPCYSHRWFDSLVGLSGVGIVEVCQSTNICRRRILSPSSRWEVIKRELIKARQEKDEALAKLAEMESRFADLEGEVVKVKQRARAEAEAEKQRIAANTEEEIRKAREQAIREVEIAGRAVRQELRRFAAEKSVRLAEAILNREIRPEDDVRITTLNVEELGRTRP